MGLMKLMSMSIMMSILTSKPWRQQHRPQLLILLYQFSSKVNSFMYTQSIRFVMSLYSHYGTCFVSPWIVDKFLCLDQAQTKLENELFSCQGLEIKLLWMAGTENWEIKIDNSCYGGC